MDLCYGCGAENGLYVTEVLGPTTRPSPTVFVFPSTSRGDIMFCNVCFDESRFRDLTFEDIETLDWFFGSANVETDPEKAIQLLQPLLHKSRTPDNLSPLGRAYIAVGRIAEGRSLLVEALGISPNHPYAREDRIILAAV